MTRERATPFDEDQPARDILLVFYSRTGRTRKLAHEVAVACGADLEEVRDVHPRGGVRGFVRSLLDAVFDRVPDIRPTELHPREYALIVLGGPVWVGALSSPLRAYILEYRRDFREVALFCSANGLLANRALRRAAGWAQRRPVLRMAFSSKSIWRERHEAAARQFADLLREHAAGVRAVRAALRAEETKNGS